ncbi:MAG: metalloregulator ArsR/SmtB family transcription factor [Bryobacteraceae bacterium]
MAIPALSDEKLIAFAADRFRLLAEPMRLRILLHLENGECAAGEVARAVGGNQPNISRHLQALHRGGVVARRRDGNTIYYSIADPAIVGVCELMCKTHETLQGSRRRGDRK